MKKLKLFAAAALAVASVSTGANATLITYGWDIVYYSDASHTKQVGFDKKPCNGKAAKGGITTPYSNGVHYLCRSEDPAW